MAFYQANDKYSATLSSGFTVGQTTLSVNSVPDNTPTLVCVAKGTTSETIFIVTGTTASSLTGVTRLKGANVNLDAQMPVTCLNNEEFLNQYATGLGIEDWISDTYAANIALNIDSEASGGKKHYIELTGNATFTLANVSNADIFIVALGQGTTGSHTVTWFANVLWANDTEPTLTTTAGQTDIFIFIELLGKYYGYIVGQDS